jgi:hypothetical protein
MLIVRPGAPMNPLHSIAYVSSARTEIPAAKLELLLRKARLYNSTHGITGVLLYSGGNFLQFLEGPTHAVMQAYHRIRLSPLHGDLIELISEPTPSRHFAGWSMAHRSISWENLMRVQAAFQPDLAQGTGVRMLKEYWSARRGTQQLRKPRPAPAPGLHRVAPAWLSAASSLSAH